MAQSTRLLPSNYPQPLASQILKADAQRQVSILRQEFATDLIGVLAEARELPVRSKLLRLIEANLSSGLAAPQRSKDLWPEGTLVKELFGESTEHKPVQAKRFLKVFEQLDRVHQRSLSILGASFENVRLILDRSQLAPPAVAKGPATAPKANATDK